MEIILFALLFPVLIAAFITFDKIVKMQYEEFKNEWIADGKPYGFFWMPKDAKWFQGGIARNRLTFTWLFKTPNWIKNNDKTKKLLLRLRLLALLWNIGIICWGVIFVVK